MIKITVYGMASPGAIQTRAWRGLIAATLGFNKKFWPTLPEIELRFLPIMITTEKLGQLIQAMQNLATAEVSVRTNTPDLKSFITLEAGHPEAHRNLLIVVDEPGDFNPAKAVFIITVLKRILTPRLNEILPGETLCLRYLALGLDPSNPTACLS